MHALKVSRMRPNPAMEVTTNIDRLEMIRLSLLMLFRAKANWIFVVVPALVFWDC